jgi:hypothetical protein
MLLISDVMRTGRDDVECLTHRNELSDIGHDTRKSIARVSTGESHDAKDGCRRLVAMMEKERKNSGLRRDKLVGRKTHR